MKKKRQVDQVGEYFSTYPDVVRKIVESGGGVEEILCYLTLCRGAGAEDVTAWSPKAIAKYMQISEKKAEKICTWFTEKKIVLKINSENPQPDVLFPPRWKIIPEGLQCNLPNSLVGKDGLGPLGNLYHSVGDYPFGVPASQAKLLQLMILICLYKFHDLEEYGGVAPTVWTKEWRVRPEVTKFNIPVGGFLAAVTQGNPTYQPALVNWLRTGGTLPVENPDKHIKLAFKNLADKRLISESLYVWDEDPLRAKASISYTLYHLEDWVRAQRNLYSIQDITEFCKNALDQQEIGRFMHGEDFHNAQQRMFTIVGYGENYQARSAIVLTHPPETLSHKIGRNTLYGKTLEFRAQLARIANRIQEEDNDNLWPY